MFDLLKRHYFSVKNTIKFVLKKRAAYLVCSVVVCAVILGGTAQFLLTQEQLGENTIAIQSKSGAFPAAQLTHSEHTEQGENFTVEHKLASVSMTAASLTPQTSPELLYIDTPIAEDVDIHTAVLFVNDAGLEFEKARVTLKKVDSQEINAILTCPTWDFDVAAGTCKDWQVAPITEFSQTDTEVAFEVSHFSAYAGAYLEILNFHSHLSQGDLWEVRFTTIGSADLTIEAAENTVPGTDISSVGFYCGDDELPQDTVFDGQKVFIPNYSCDGKVSKIVQTAITPGPHTQRFRFGDSDEYAHNFACNSGTLDDTCTVSSSQAMTDNYAISGAGSLLITGTGALTGTIGQTFSIAMTGDVTIQSGGTITGNLTSLTAANVTVAGSINVNGKGYAGGGIGGNGAGTGGGIGAAANGGGGGGGHGGTGGTSTSSLAGGAVYGSVTEPVTFGSGGGGLQAISGAAGGGRVKIEATSTVSVSGSVTANGSNGTIGNGSLQASGGGAGGSLWVSAPSITGSGSFTAIGGNGGDNTSHDGGGGAGGRVALYYTTLSDTLTLSAYGGTPAARFGGAGSIYKKPSGQTYGDLLIDNNNKSDTTYNAIVGVTELNDAIALNTLTLQNYGALRVGTGDNISYSSLSWGTKGVITYDGGTFTLLNGTSDLDVSATSTFVLNTTGTFDDGTVAGTFYSNSPATFHDLTVTGIVTTFNNTTTEQYKVDLTTTNNLTVSGEGTITVTGKGYSAGSGAGAGGGSGTNGGGGGGGHGGTGGYSSNNLVGGGVYGSVNEPSTLGSGGGNTLATLGGAGGGSIKLTTAGTLTIAGSIAANGAAGNLGNGNAQGGGGGAGGSIWVNAGSITGAGTVSALGGAGGDGSGFDGGGGGGGRIALHYTSYSNAATLTAYGGVFTGRFGGAGTVFTQQAAQAYGDLLIDNNDKSAVTYTAPFGVTVLPSAQTVNALTLQNYGALKTTADLTYSSINWGTKGVIIDDGGAFTLFNGTQDVTVSATSTLILNNEVTFDSGNIAGILYGHAHTTFTDLTVSGTLSTFNNSTTELYKLDIETLEDFTITGAATINLTGKGYSPGTSGNGSGPGAGLGAASNGGAGGGAYGGDGGDSTSQGGTAYGSQTSPANIGSGGGGRNGASGGAGGGAIKLTSGGTLSLGAPILVDGNPGTNLSSRFGGGGAGGSIWIVAQNLTGAGNLYARGGAASTGGGGGGGRIALWTGASTHSGAISAAAGSAGGSTGGAGTVYTDYTSPSSSLTELCETAGNACTIDGAAADPVESYAVTNLTGIAAETDTQITSMQISVKDTSTGKWYSQTSDAFDQDTIYYFDISTLDQTLPYTGTVNWSHDMSGIPFVIDNTYLITVAARNPQITHFETSEFIFSNSPPTLTNLTASQNATGTVDISYDVSDMESSQTSIYTLYDRGAVLGSNLDTGTGGVVVSSGGLFPNSGTIMIDDEFITFTGKSSNTLTGITRAANNTKNVVHTAGAEVWIVAPSVTGHAGANVPNGTNRAVVWTAKSDLNGIYATNIKVRVLTNDGASSSMLDYADTAGITIDAKDPILSSSFRINNSLATPLIYVPCTDDTALQMRIGTASDLTGATWVSQLDSLTPAAAGITVTSDMTFYGQCRDAKGNTTAIQTSTIPAVPQNIFFKDVTSVIESEYREFVTWGVVAEPALGFASYNVYRKTNSGSFTLVSTITDRTVNYFLDATLSAGATYTYKVSTSDDNGNVSAYSEVVTDEPNGSGGSEEAVENTLTSVSVSNISATQATVTWTSSEYSNSTVYYEATNIYPGSNKSEYETSRGVPSIVTTHSVILSGLTPNTYYSFLVESVDTASTSTTDADNAYQFTTTSGPVVSNVSVTRVYDEQSVITWQTNTAANSQVIYSKNADLSSSTVVGSDDLTQNHSVNLTGLDVATTYYFYVVSTDASSNTTTNKNIVNGVNQYFTFSTTLDSIAPVISGVTTSYIGEKGATITWETNEDATSQVTWGTTTGLGSTTATTTTYGTRHSVTLTDLAAATEYYYRVVSVDRGGNSTTSSETKSLTTASGTVVERAPDLTASGLQDEVTTALTSIVETASKSILGAVFNAIKKNPNLSSMSEEDVVSLVAEIADESLSAPTIGGSELGIEPAATSAVISWTTNKAANTLVGYVAEAQYDANSPNPYTNEVGNSSASTTTHSVTIEGLEPETTYHFQTRSKTSYGPQAVSADNVFTTTPLVPNIADVRIEKIQETGASFVWSTNIPTRSVVEMTEVASGEVTLVELPNFRRNHVYEADQLSPSSSYNAKITSIDEDGKSTEPSVLSFFTTSSDEPPKISDVRVVTSLIPGKVEQVQTIISWKTNKPASSVVRYQEGVTTDSNLTQTITAENALKRDHIVISSAFQPGKVYSYRVESTDSGRVTGSSESFTLLTPRPQESVVDLIVNNLEEMFGFLR